MAFRALTSGWSAARTGSPGDSPLFTALRASWSSAGAAGRSAGTPLCVAAPQRAQHGFARAVNARGSAEQRPSPIQRHGGGPRRWQPDAGTQGITNAALLSSLEHNGAPAASVCSDALRALTSLRTGGLPFNLARQHDALHPFLDSLAGSIERHGAAWPSGTLARLATEVTVFAKGGLPRQQVAFLTSPSVRRLLRGTVLGFLPQLHTVPPALIAGMCAALVRSDVMFVPLFASVGGWLVAADGLMGGDPSPAPSYSDTHATHAGTPARLFSPEELASFSSVCDPSREWLHVTAGRAEHRSSSPLEDTPPQALVQLLWVFTRPGALGDSSAGAQATVVICTTLLRRLLPYLRGAQEEEGGGAAPSLATGGAQTAARGGGSALSVESSSASVGEYDYSLHRRQQQQQRLRTDEARPALHLPVQPASVHATARLPFDRIPQLLQCLSTLPMRSGEGVGGWRAIAQDAVDECCRALVTAAHTAPLFSTLPREGGSDEGDMRSRDGEEGDAAPAPTALEPRHVVSALRALEAGGLHLLSPATCAAATSLVDRAQRLLTGQAMAIASWAVHSSMRGAGVQQTKIVTAFKPAELTGLLDACAGMASGRGEGGMRDPFHPGTVSPAGPNLAATTALQQQCRLTFHLAAHAVVSHTVHPGGAQSGDPVAQVQLLCAHATAGAPLAPLAAHLCHAVAVSFGRETVVPTPSSASPDSVDLRSAPLPLLCDLAWGLSASLSPDWDAVAGQGRDGRGPYLPPCTHAEEGRAAGSSVHLHLSSEERVGWTTTSGDCSVPLSSLRGAVATIATRVAGRRRESVPSASLVKLVWACAAADVYPGPLLAALVRGAAGVEGTDGASPVVEDGSHHPLAARDVTGLAAGEREDASLSLVLRELTLPQLSQLGLSLSTLAARPAPSAMPVVDRSGGGCRASRPWAADATALLQAVAGELRARPPRLAQWDAPNEPALVLACAGSLATTGDDAGQGAGGDVGVVGLPAPVPARSSPAAVLLQQLHLAVLAYLAEEEGGRSARGPVASSPLPPLHLGWSPGPPLPATLRIPLALPSLRLAFTLERHAEEELLHGGGLAGTGGAHDPCLSLTLHSGRRHTAHAGLHVAEDMLRRCARDLLRARGWTVVRLNPVAVRGATGVRAKARVVRFGVNAAGPAC